MLQWIQILIPLSNPEENVYECNYCVNVRESYMIFGVPNKNDS